MAHVFFGMLGIMLAVAIFVYVLHVNKKNIATVRKLSILVPLFTIFSYVIGGWWYVVYYPHERNIIRSGSWVWAHTFFMEVKEHLFFMLLMLTILLPIVIYKDDLIMDRSNRNLVLTILALIVLLGFSMEGAGAIISRGVIVGYMGR